VIANFQYQDGDFDAEVTGFSALDIDQTGFLGEVQHLHQWSDLDLIVGAGWADVDREENLTFLVPFPSRSSTERIRHFNFYAYPEIKPTDDLVITAGASVDLMNGGFRDRDQINPKFGIEWEPLAGTTIRGAAFRTLARTLVGSQTIEPVAVAGFNQFYDDPEGTDSWQIGLGIDQRLSADADAPLYAGVELFRRELDLVGQSQVGPGTVQGDGHETVGRAYLYWAPDPMWAFTVEYQFEDFERQAQLPGPEGFKDVETHRASIGGGFFHPSGFTARMQISFIDQQGEFVSGPPGVFASGHDDFVVVDAALGYRLPDRYGFIGVVGKNLFDEKFQFQDTDPGNPSVIPDRQFLVQGTFFF
jgi:hypothetical protein